MINIKSTKIQYTIDNYNGPYIKTHKIPNKTCGIYLLYSEDEELIYIGKSINCIYSRLSSHFKESDRYVTSERDKIIHNMKKEETYYFSYSVISKEYVNSVESFLINKYKPKYNNPSNIIIQKLISKSDLIKLYNSLCD